VKRTTSVQRPNRQMVRFTHPTRLDTWYLLKSASSVLSRIWGRRMTGRIFHLSETGEATPMEEQPYDAESVVQQLLAQHPDLLAGDQINSSDPRRWLLVSREMGVPGEEGGAAKWSLDHLFLDQDAIPTLVEVKRSTDTRIRREVLGQMLDYAANAVAYWPLEDIRARLEAQCEANSSDPEEELGSLLGEEHDTGDFWQQVKTNLQTGRIRMVFIADEIPTELRRIVEFLNGQMDPAEVLAIEIKQFVGEGMKTLVPRVVGQTESARQKKGGSKATRETISEEEFLTEFDSERTPEEQQVARRFIAWARRSGLRDDFRRGQKGSAFIPVLEREGQRFYPILLQRRGMVVIQMRWLRGHAPFNDAIKRQQLFERIKDIPGLRITEAGMEGFPKIAVGSLADENLLDGFLQTLDWIVDQIYNSQGVKSSSVRETHVG